MHAAPIIAALPPPEVRAFVRDLLQASEAYHGLDAATRKDIASSLVRISATALALADAADPDGPRPAPAVRPLAYAQNAGSEFSGVAADRVAGTTRQILNAVSFPRFVTELITGVFKAMVDSNQQQMTAFVDLIKNVAASAEGFADANVSMAGARAWLAERFPGFVIQGDDDGMPADEGMTPEELAELRQERDASTRLRLRPGAAMPTEAALRTALGLGPNESVPTGDPESLVDLARQAMARNRQQMLSTMVMLGLQRVVIDSGRIDAAMRFHIDTHSAAADDRGSTFDVRNETSVDVGGKIGSWGVDAQMKNTIGYVSTQRTQTTEEMNTDLDLNSSVELIFRTDYVPLERLAGTGDVNRIRVNSLNPEAEAKIAAEDRKARREGQGRAESARSSELDKALHPPPPIPAQPKPAPAAPAKAGPSDKEGPKKDEAKKEEPKKEAQQAPKQGSGSHK